MREGAGGNGTDNDDTAKTHVSADYIVMNESVSKIREDSENILKLYMSVSTTFVLNSRPRKMSLHDFKSAVTLPGSRVIHHTTESLSWSFPQPYHNMTAPVTIQLSTGFHLYPPVVSLIVEKNIFYYRKLAKKDNISIVQQSTRPFNFTEKLLVLIQ
ncbi:hypothetical protein KIN20_020239 [Parelaphostrongylus tenuis]|uniref:Uncharacterized protein n=1 Tax=Parelaphostrongylus tenuis TaxID=148309 RepID=A0AAD5MM51_PARTN|nr:hypothetical protein KIN20_020239 [Parelaphostrongylus tenuis]